MVRWITQNLKSHHFSTIRKDFEELSIVPMESYFGNIKNLQHLPFTWNLNTIKVKLHSESPVLEHHQVPRRHVYIYKHVYIDMFICIHKYIRSYINLFYRDRFIYFRLKTTDTKCVILNHFSLNVQMHLLIDSFYNEETLYTCTLSEVPIKWFLINDLPLRWSEMYIYLWCFYWRP